MTLKKETLEAIKIKPSDELIREVSIALGHGDSDFQDILFRENTKKSIKINNPAPYYIYIEVPAKNDPKHKVIINGLMGEDSASRLFYSSKRSILNLSPDLDDGILRGKILVAFCEIEFIMDILICHQFGIYEDKVSYDSIHKNCFSSGGFISRFRDKRHFLRFEGIFDPSLDGAVKETQIIRNRIAHRYFFDSPSRNNKEKYERWLKDIEMKYNYAWLLLLKKYNEIQLEVIKWVNDKNESI